MTTETTALVELALAKSGYTAKFLAARLWKTTDTDEVYVASYYNDDGEIETCRVYVDLATGKGEF